MTPSMKHILLSLVVGSGGQGVRSFALEVLFSTSFVTTFRREFGVYQIGAEAVYRLFIACLSPFYGLPCIVAVNLRLDEVAFSWGDGKTAKSGNRQPVRIGLCIEIPVSQINAKVLLNQGKYIDFLNDFP